MSGQQADDFGPPRWPGDTRPPFAPGNSMAFQPGHEHSLQHGAWSPRKVEPIAATLVETLATDAPWTVSPAFAGAVRSWAHAEAQAQLLRTYIDEHGHFDDEGEERSAVRTLDRVEARLIKLRAGLGLDPQSLAKLFAGAATLANATGDAKTLEGLAAEGQRILASRLSQTDQQETP